MQHRKNRRGFIITFLVMWCVGVLAFILGVSGKVDAKLAVLVFCLAFLCACLVMLLMLYVVRCGGCGTVLFNFTVDPENAPERTWRDFVCRKCGDTTLVKGNVRWGVGGD